MLAENAVVTDEGHTYTGWPPSNNGGRAIAKYTYASEPFAFEGGGRQHGCHQQADGNFQAAR